MTRWTLALAGLMVIGCGSGGGDDTAEPTVPTLTIGTASNVTYAAAAADPEAAAMLLHLTIATAGNYQCTAHAEGHDAQMAIFQGTTEVARDSDSGEGVDAMIAHELAAGAYDVKVWEWTGQAASIAVTCAAGPTAVPLTLGTPAQATVAAGEGAQADLTLTITEAGSYRCDAHGVSGAEGRDAQMILLQGDTELSRDSDSGEDVDAQITSDLQPGTYTVRVTEWMNRDAAVTVTCAVAPPPGERVVGGELVVGTASTVNVAAGEGPVNEADLTLTIAEAGNYQCDAHSDADAQMGIWQNDAELQNDQDSGEGTDAQIIRTLEPGTYTVRVWEWTHQAAAITVTCAAAPPT